MKEATLARVRAEMNSGDLYKARDRLHGLLVTYPNDLEIRRLLGEVYWQLRYPAMAGRYWYLLASDDPRHAKAVEAFARMHGDSEWEMIRAVKYRGDVAALKSVRLRDKIQVHQRRYPNQPKPTRDSALAEFGPIGCAVIGFIVLFFFIYGIYAFITRG